MSEILKNTLIAEHIGLAGAATPVICPGRQTPSRRHCFIYFIFYQWQLL